MSHLVLARKSRPQTFAEVVGQKAVIKTLQNSITRNRIAHAILFSGVRGVGKTTLARIMAKAINCGAKENKPCNKCTSCKDIAGGQSLDVIEIDGASNNGVDDVRNLKEIVHAQPAIAKYKIIIIDEVHMLSNSAFNALLKVLEEPPSHACFMFATTEIHKIPVTILSRCQQYELKKIPAQQLHQHFTRLAQEEGFAVEEAAMSLIVRESDGSIRDGLSLLEQMFSFAENTITLNDVTEVLGLVGRDTLQKVATALLQGDRVAAFEGLQEVLQFGVDRKRFFNDLLTTFRNLFFCAVSCSQLIDTSEQERAELQKITQGITAESIHLKLTLLMEAAEKVGRATHPQFVIETAFMQIIEAGNVVPLATILGKMEEILPEIEHLSEDAISSIPTTPSSLPTAPHSSFQPGSDTTGKTKAKPVLQTPQIIPEKRDEIELKTSQQETVKKKEDKFYPKPEEVNPKNQANLSSLSKKKIEDKWVDFISHTEENRAGLAPVLRSIEHFEFTTETSPPLLHLYYGSREESLILNQNDNFNQLNQLALDFFGEQIILKIHQPEKKEKEDKNSPRTRRNKLIQEPLVRMAETVFHGKVSAVRLISQKNNNEKANNGLE